MTHADNLPAIGAYMRAAYRGFATSPQEASAVWQAWAFRLDIRIPTLLAAVRALRAKAENPPAPPRATRGNIAPVARLVLCCLWCKVLRWQLLALARIWPLRPPAPRPQPPNPRRLPISTLMALADLERNRTSPRTAPQIPPSFVDQARASRMNLSISARSQSA